MCVCVLCICVCLMHAYCFENIDCLFCCQLGVTKGLSIPCCDDVGLQQQGWKGHTPVILCIKLPTARYSLRTLFAAIFKSPLMTLHKVGIVKDQ